MSASADDVRGLRMATGLTQAQFAARVGISQPRLSSFERGHLQPTASMLARIEDAARLRPSQMVEQHADELLGLAGRFHMSNLRVFGSSVHGTDTRQSDVDLLVTLSDDASLFDVGGFSAAAETLLGYPVDVVSDRAPASRVMSRILAEAVPL